MAIDSILSRIANVWVIRQAEVVVGAKVQYFASVI
jgi:hypothetical protein